MTSPLANAGFPDRQLDRRRRRPARPANQFATSFQFIPRLEFMEDRTLLSTLLVNTTADSGAGSLRQAILDSNAAASGTSTIDFAIPGSGVHTISPASPLPVITRGVLIDGFSQPGYAGAPLIELRGDLSNGGSGSSSHSSSSSGLSSANGASGTLGSAAGGISVSSGSLTIPGSSNTVGNSALITGDGLTITGPGVTVRGLDINSFSQGAGIHITGTGATADWIYGNFLGTDPTGTLALPNDFGVQISSGASNNLVGGTTSAAGNLIAFNTGPGVDVEGDTSVGNQIRANRIFANDGPSGLRFDGSNYVSLPPGLVDGSEHSETLEASFQTSSGGVIFGYQSASPGTNPNGWAATLYVGTDGKLYGGLYDTSLGSIEQVTSNGTVNDDQWHSVALVVHGEAGTLTLYLDGQLIGSVSGSPAFIAGSFDQIGTGYTAYWPAAPYGWYGFVGQIDNVRVWSEARSAGAIGRDMAGSPSGTEPGLEAYYPFNEGQGTTAHDQTPNHNDGTLASISGDRPAWVVASGEAIDLGDDGITYDSSAPRQGPNNLQNFPIIVTTADGKLQGWLGGSTPDTSFRIDVFAGASYSADGAGQAQDYLGSLDVTTDSQGQVVFDVPFTAPAGLSIVTATATDPQCNTSEVSSMRRATVETPTQPLRLVPGQPPSFSAATGEEIALQDPDAGPLDPAWDLTLSVAAGTLALSSLAGLVGSGNGTSTLQYQGSLSALNTALEGMTFTATTGFSGNTTLSLNADSEGAPALQAKVMITDGFFAVTTTADSGPGSLRQAILESDAATGGSNTIDFAIAGQGVQTIAPLSPLPAITNPVLIDGFSQPGYAGTPLIELSGSQAGSADGLTITCSDVTVRGLDVSNFASGAGILITGMAATGNTISANDIGTDPTGLQASHNDFGVQISGGAQNNLVGGTSAAAAGNLIAFNTGPGVDIEGETSVGNQITANRIFANDNQGALQFDGSNYVSLPNNLLDGMDDESTIEASFETMSGGVILGYQDSDTSDFPGGYIPSLYVGTDGKLYGQWNGVQLITSAETVDDGRWHQVAFVGDGQSGTVNLYLDGVIVGSASGSPSEFDGGYDQIGTGYTAYYYPNTNGGWYGFVGHIAEVRIWNVALSAAQVQQDRATPSAATAPGLVADYPLDDGQGLTAHELTPNQNDGTLEGSNGDLPAWVAPAGEAIDLGDDGITYNASSPRQGPNNLQNFPIIVTTADGKLQGWLGGSTPDTSFRIDVFASAAFSLGGAGQAQDYLGSLDVTTDSHGQVIFDVPFTAPTGLPDLTATATDPQGNTSEVSAERRVTLEAPTQLLRLVPGQSLSFLSASGDGIAIEDLDAGPLDPAWDLSLSVTEGTLALSTLNGLVGSGNGTSTLQYQGSPSALNAALEGLRYSQAAGSHGYFTMYLDAASEGAPAFRVQVNLTDSIFLVTTTADSGPGSLRQAILDSNTATGGSNTIDFAIPGTGAQTIAPASPLPTITTRVVIDGTTQPGYAGAPLIAIVSQGTADADPLTVGSDVKVKGLTVGGFTFPSVSSSTMFTFESVPLPQAPGGTVTYQFTVAAGEDLVATAQAVSATTSLSLLDAQGHIVMQSDGLSAAEPIDAIDTYIGPGTYSLQVRDKGGNGAFTLTTMLMPSAAPFQGIPTGASPSAIVAGDFNGDGRLDLAVANAYSGTISILLGNGDGTFQPQVTYAVGSDPGANEGFGSYPIAIVAGDFNGDGRTDLAVANDNLNTVSVLLGNGDGTFQPQVTYAVGLFPHAIVAGDFTGDGHLDLAVAFEGDKSFGGTDPGGVAVLLGNGDGTFQPQVTYAAGLGPISIAAGDFTGDGHLDLAVAFQGNFLVGTDPGGVAVLLGNGDGTFQPQVTYAVGLNPDAIVTGDFNRDGKLDLVVANYNSNDVSVLLGNGDGTFQPQVTYAVGSLPEGIVAGDFNGDGRLDLAVANFGSSTVSVLLGNGDGAFQPQVTYAAGSALQAIVAGDFTGDGRTDLAVADANSNDVSLLLGNGDGTFQVQSQTRNAVESTPDVIVAGDFAGDGRLDLAIAGGGSNTVSVLLGDGDGTFQPEATYAVGLYPDAIVAGDFNGDGRLDLAVSENAGVQILLGNGDGTFQPARTVAVGLEPVAIVAGDFNGDGRTDLAVADANSNDVSVLLGNGDGTFQPQVTYAVGSIPERIVAGNFNGDGRLDLAVANFGSSTVSVLLGNGDGTFRPQVTYAVGLEPDAIVAGDFNGDGRTDLAVADANSNDVSVLLGNGDGTFQPQVTYAVGSYPGAIVAGDFNGDGHLDLATANLVDNDVSVLLGNGDGTFQPQVTYAVGLNPDAIVAGDFNGDGRTDLAVANLFSNDVSVLLGLGNGTFADPSQLATGPHATPLVADVNGDGTDDVLVVDGAGNILYRQGIPGRPGTFEPPVTVNPAALPGGPNAYTSRDIAWVPNTMDGPLLASVDAQDAKVSLYAYRDGTFVRVGSLATGQLPAQVIAADLSGTGWDDLVVRNAGDGTLSIYFNADDKTVSGPAFMGPKDTGNQLFGFPVTLPAGIGVSDVQAVDATGDGRLDLVVTDKLTGQVSVLLNLGGGKFAAPVPYRAGTGLSAVDPGSTPEVSSLEATAGVAAGPFTTGSPTDLVTINPGSKTLDMLAGLGGGRFADPITIQTTSPAQVVRVADFTGDGIPDLAVLTALGLSIYLGNGKGGFLAPVTYAVPVESSGLTVADVNHDGNADLLVGDAYGDVLVLLGNGNGTFQPYHEANQSVELAVADLSGNGTKDIIYADQGLDRVVVDYGAGDSAVLANHSTGLLDPGALALADLNGDGIPDLIVANSGSNNVLIYPGLGNGQFGPAINDGNGYFVGTNPVGITVANLTGALPDLVVADEGSNDVAILLNQGNFSFTPGPRLDSGGIGPVSTVVGDFTSGSTIPDILATNSGSKNVTLLQGVGDGFFKPPTASPFSVGGNPVQSFVGNFDGTPGLLTVNAGSNDLTLISDFNGPDPVTTTISSGGLDPDTAFAFESSSGFDDLVVGNSGDGVLALFEGGSGGLTLMSTQTEPNLPSPTDLAFASLTGGQVEFYAATAGHEAATLVALSLSGETLAQTESGLSLATVTNAAQLVPLNESSLALVASLLTLTISTNENELSLESAQTEAAASVPSLSSTSASSGQSLSGQSGRGFVGTEEAEQAGESADPANPGSPGASPWERFMLGLDQALEQFRREFQIRILGRESTGTEREQPATKPSADASAPDAPTSFRSTPDPVPNGSEDAPIESEQPAERGEAVDASIDAIWSEDARLVVPAQSLRLAGAPFRLVVAGDEPSPLLLASAFLTGFTLVARPGLARSKSTSNFSPVARRDRLAPVSRTGKA